MEHDFGRWYETKKHVPAEVGENVAGVYHFFLHPKNSLS